MAERASPPAPRAVADRLHSAAIHLLRTLRRADQALGVGPAKLSALSVLVFGGPRSIGALARVEPTVGPSIALGRWAAAVAARSCRSSVSSE